MRKLAFLLVPLLLFSTGCELGAPDKIKAQAVDALRPFFPNAQVVVDTQNSIILGMSCAQGVGPNLINEVQRVLPTIPAVSQLRQLRMAALFGSTSYKYFAIGFADTAVRLDVDSWTIEQVHPGPAYEQSYRQTCGITEPGGERPVTYAWVGVWEIPSSQGTQQVTDSLGIYSLDDFASHRNIEISARETILRKTVAERGLNGDSIRLVDVRAIPLTPSVLASSIEGQ